MSKKRIKDWRKKFSTNSIGDRKRQFEKCIEYKYVLNLWEQEFVESLQKRGVDFLSNKQRTILDRISAKVQRYLKGPVIRKTGIHFVSGGLCNGK